MCVDENVNMLWKGSEETRRHYQFKNLFAFFLSRGPAHQRSEYLVLYIGTDNALCMYYSRQATL